MLYEAWIMLPYEAQIMLLNEARIMLPFEAQIMLPFKHELFFALMHGLYYPPTIVNYPILWGANNYILQAEDKDSWTIITHSTAHWQSLVTIV